MATGTVKWFNTQKGFGFIQPDDGTKDVFVHISAVEKSGIGSLRDGQKISYDVIQDRGKPAATNLKGSWAPMHSSIGRLRPPFFYARTPIDLRMHCAVTPAGVDR